MFIIKRFRGWKKCNIKGEWGTFYDTVTLSKCKTFKGLKRSRYFNALIENKNYDMILECPNFYKMKDGCPFLKILQTAKKIYN